jgi:hypothetical protein
MIHVRQSRRHLRRGFPWCGNILTPDGSMPAWDTARLPHLTYSLSICRKDLGRRRRVRVGSPGASASARQLLGLRWWLASGNRVAAYPHALAHQRRVGQHPPSGPSRRSQDRFARDPSPQHTISSGPCRPLEADPWRHGRRCVRRRISRGPVTPSTMPLPMSTAGFGDPAAGRT